MDPFNTQGENMKDPKLCNNKVTNEKCTATILKRLKNKIKSIGN